MEFLDTIVQYKIEIAIPIVVAVLIKALKAAFKKFWTKNYIGYKLIYFLPLIFGTPMGLLLTKYPVADRLMLGAALGGLSHFIYKMITVAVVSKTTALKKMGEKTSDGA